MPNPVAHPPVSERPAHAIRAVSREQRLGETAVRPEQWRIFARHLGTHRRYTAQIRRLARLGLLGLLCLLGIFGL